MDRPYVLVRKESHETEGGVRASLGSQSDGGISSRGRMKRHDPRRCPLGRHRGDKVCQRGTPPGWVFPETSGEASRNWLGGHALPRAGDGGTVSHAVAVVPS